MSKKVDEYDLDAPTLPKCERNEFRLQTRSLTSLYERCVQPKMVAENAWKVLVEVVPNLTFARHRNLLGVLVVQIVDDPSLLFRTEHDDARQELALGWLQGSVN